MAVILVLSSQSNLPARTDPATGERIGATYSLAKIWHVIEYSILTLLVLRATHGKGGALNLRPPRAAMFAVLVATTFAALDEFRQSFVPNRKASYNDVILDAAAAIIVALIFLAWAQARIRRARAPASPSEAPRA